MLANKFNYQLTSEVMSHKKKLARIMFDKLTRALFSKVNRHLNNISASYYIIICAVPFDAFGLKGY